MLLIQNFQENLLPMSYYVEGSQIVHKTFREQMELKLKASPHSSGVFNK